MQKYARPYFSLTRLLGFVMIAAAVVLAYFFASHHGKPKQLRLETAPGERQIAVLPDGSKVELNGSSVLAWSVEDQARSREVTLMGQAFFEVVKEARPFVVNTNTARIKTTGTLFDVWARNELTRVEVASGRVILLAHGDPQGVVLTTGFSSCVLPGQRPLPPERPSTAEQQDWRNGKIVFRDQTLSAVCLDLMATFDAEVELDEAVARDLVFRGTFQNKTLEAILDELCHGLALTWQKEGSGYLLRLPRE